jgi:fatty acid desaturase
MAMTGMDAVPKELLRKAYERKHLYLLKIPFAFGLWGGALWLLYRMQDHPWAIPVGIACSLMITYLIRGLGAIAHDAVHGNCTRSKLGSYLISLLCWSPTAMSVTIYSNYHLHHHRIANTYPDVDNFVVTDYVDNPVLAKALLLLVYLGGYPIYFMFQMFRYIKRLTPWQRVRMNVELIGIFSLIGLAAHYMPTYVFLFFYGAPFIMGSFFASMTSMIEHFGMEASDDDAYSSRTYGTSCALTNFIWNNVTYHNEHHKFPGIPWYNLASFYRAAYPHYDDQVKAACHKSIYGIAFKLYGDVLKLDVPALQKKYAQLDKRAEKQRAIGVPGISVGNATS